MLRRGEGASKMLKHRKSGDTNESRLSHLLTELAKKISNSLGDSGERATEVPGLMLYRRTCSDRSESVYPRAKPSCHCARKLFVSAPSERRLSWPPEATSASSASGLLFHTVAVCPAFKRLAAIRDPIAPRPRNPAFAHVYSFLHVSHIT